MLTTPEYTAQKNYKDWYASTKAKAILPDLTAEEKARPFAKYFYDEIEMPDPAHYAMMEIPCDPAQAITPEQINDLLDPGYLAVEIGWCNLPNGAGFIANKIVYPEVTAEMIDWWFAWHPLEDLRYRIWYPPQHGGIMVSPEGRKRLLD
jgi:phloretin hydrolase